ncbi:hypothetical protein BGX28_003983 [Mortierella sp. GBA30]|nr:hypothetical protein BGX28_003983 [Mortierella sp. GBA30]
MAEHKETILAWLEAKPAEPSLRALSSSNDRPPTTRADEAVSQPLVQANGYKSDPASTNYDIFKYSKYHVDATTSILTFAGNAAGFHPNVDDLNVVAEKYDAYIDKINGFPGFFLSFNHKSKSYQTSIDINLMVSDIKDAYEGVLTLDVDKIVESVKKMANSVLSKSHSDESQSLFVQTAVRKDPNSDKVEVSIYYTTFHMKKDKSGKKTYTEQAYTINRTKFDVITSALTANADSLAEKILKKPFDDWLNDNSTPTDSKLMSCVEKHYQAKEQ